MKPSTHSFVLGFSSLINGSPLSCIQLAGMYLSSSRRLPIGGSQMGSGSVHWEEYHPNADCAQ